MRTDGNSTAKMANHQVQIFVSRMMLTGIPTSNRPLIQRMPDGDARHQRRACNVRNLIHLVHYTGICYKGTATGKHGSQLISYETPQVTGMRTHGMKRILPHGLIHLVHPAGNRFHQTATTDNGIKPERNALLLQFGKHK